MSWMAGGSVLRLCKSNVDLNVWGSKDGWLLSPACESVDVGVHLAVPSFTHLFKENACCRTRSRQNGVLGSENFALTKAGVGCECTGSPFVSIPAIELGWGSLLCRCDYGLLGELCGFLHHSGLKSFMICDIEICTAFYMKYFKNPFQVIKKHCLAGKTLQWSLATGTLLPSRLLRTV